MTDRCDLMTPPRILPSEIGPVVPIADIAEEFNLDKTTIIKAVRSHKDAFAALKCFQLLPSSGGMQRNLCLNEKGIGKLLLIVRPKKSNDTLIEKVDAFREKLIQSRPSVQQRQVPQIPAGPAQPATEQQSHIATLEDAREAIHMARALAPDLGIPETLAISATLRYLEREKGLEVAHLRAALPPPAAPSEREGWLNASQIGKMLNPPMSAQRVNNYLNWPGHQYQVWNNALGRWEPTELGLPYSKLVSYQDRWNGHSGWQLLWDPAIITVSGMARI